MRLDEGLVVYVPYQFKFYCNCCTHREKHFLGNPSRHIARIYIFLFVRWNVPSVYFLFFFRCIFWNIFAPENTWVLPANSKKKKRKKYRKNAKKIFDFIITTLLRLNTKFSYTEVRRYFLWGMNLRFTDFGLGLFRGKQLKLLSKRMAYFAKYPFLVK